MALNPNFDPSLIARGYQEAFRILTEIRPLLAPQAEQLDEIRGAIDFCSRGIDTGWHGIVHFPLYFGNGVTDTYEGIVKRAISEGRLDVAIERWERITNLATRGSLLDRHYGISSDVSKRFEALDRGLRSRVNFSAIAQTVAGSIGSPPSPLLASDSAILAGGVDYLRGGELQKLLREIETEIIHESRRFPEDVSRFLENVERARTRTNLLVAGICVALVASFSVCAYFLSRPVPSYKDFPSR